MSYAAEQGASRATRISFAGIRVYFSCITWIPFHSTGWAQVSGLRGEITEPETMRLRVQHDIHYIEHWSLAFDLKILCLTLMVGFVNKNAY